MTSPSQFGREHAVAWRSAEPKAVTGPSGMEQGGPIVNRSGLGRDGGLVRLDVAVPVGRRRAARGAAGCSDSWSAASGWSPQLRSTADEIEISADHGPASVTDQAPSHPAGCMWQPRHSVRRKSHTPPAALASTAASSSLSRTGIRLLLLLARVRDEIHVALVCHVLFSPLARVRVRTQKMGVNTLRVIRMTGLR